MVSPVVKVTSPKNGSEHDDDGEAEEEATVTANSTPAHMEPQAREVDEAQPLRLRAMAKMIDEPVLVALTDEQAREAAQVRLRSELFCVRGIFPLSLCVLTNICSFQRRLAELQAQVDALLAVL